MVTEPVRVVSVRRLEALRASRRRLRCGLGLMVCLAMVLAVRAVERPEGAKPLAGGLEFPDLVGPAEAASGRAPFPEGGLLSAVEDPLYQQFLKAYVPLARDGERRRYLTTQVLAAAVMHRLDPDLLFALIAAESGFDSDAVSPGEARGLGQMVFATALHLRQLLDETQGDLRRALRAYYAGLADRHATAPDREQFCARVATHYASLKVKRSHDRLAAVTAAGADETESLPGKFASR